MKTDLRIPILASVTLFSALIVLLGYFMDLPGLSDLRQLFLDWAAILAAVALVIGVLNLARVHWGRVKSAQKGSVNSLVLIASMLVTLLVVGILGGPTATWPMWIYNSILVPIEASLLALLAVVLIYAFARMFRRRFSIPTLVFAVVVLFVLIGAFTLPGLEIFLLGDLRAWVTQVWALGGMRGILIGVALGAIATGLRVIMGSDRPYGG